MNSPKSLAQREKELRSLLATPQGKRELQELVQRYQAVDGRPAGKSLITYIIVHERARGHIVG